jgi:hypothetical protein
VQNGGMKERRQRPLTALFAAKKLRRPDLVHNRDPVDENRLISAYRIESRRGDGSAWGSQLPSNRNFKPPKKVRCILKDVN